MTYYLGIDIGSVTSKGVIAENSKIVDYHIISSGVNYRDAALRVRDELLEKTRIQFSNIDFTAATGQGAESVEFCNRRVDDIMCCARGIAAIFPSVKTVIDVQGQCTRIIRINEKGNVTDFVISEKCAAGSGRFLQIMANILRIKIEDIGRLSKKSENPVTFTTGCAVFCESEAVSRVSEGFSKEDILAGVHLAIANKISALADRVGLVEDCAISGGGGLDIGLIAYIEEKLGIQLLVPQNPQVITAFGAAIMASRG